jgi:MFS-type transporter involved in bile tolerance (Atg22 family)
MKRVREFFNTTVILFSVMTALSFWITKTDNWHLYLPICLICMAINQSLNEKQ